jgi:hypothetical protein
MLVGLTHHDGVRIAEVGFLLLVFGGVWLASGQVPFFGHPRARSVVAGLAFALGGVLLIVAIHWGHFG